MAQLFTDGACPNGRLSGSVAMCLAALIRYPHESRLGFQEDIVRPVNGDGNDEVCLTRPIAALLSFGESYQHWSERSPSIQLPTVGLDKPDRSDVTLSQTRHRSSP